MQPLLYLVLWILVAIILMWLAMALLGAFKTPEPWRTVVLALIGLVLALAFLQRFVGPIW